MAEVRPRISYFKEWIPTPVCMFLSMFFAMVFQFNGGVFLPTAYQMSSALGCIQEDVNMAAYASYIGMTVIFPILFRLKNRFMTRHILLTVCAVLVVCNLIMLHSESLPVFCVVCFISGFFRMWGTFECFSNSRLSVTPSGNFSVFYPVIYIVVLESIQLSGLVATHVTDWATWRYMHWLVIAFLLLVWLLVLFCTRRVRNGKRIPLYGVDWLSAVLWTVILFSVVFVCIYGEYYDWLDSAMIRMALVVAAVSLMININRMCTLKRPYIDIQVFRYRHFPTILFLFLMLCFFLTVSSVLQNLFMTSVLGYDSLNAISLNWYVFVGILIGSATVFYRQVVLRKGFKFLIYVGFLLILVYQYYMYFLIDPDLNIESFYLPNLLKGIGHGILYICLTIYIAKSVPFKHFFQGLCVLSFIRTSVATPLGTAILNRSLKYMQQDNIGLLSRNIDQSFTSQSTSWGFYDLYAEVVRQTMLTSLKELFGVVCILGSVFLLGVLLFHPVRSRWHYYQRRRRNRTNRISGNRSCEAVGK